MFLKENRIPTKAAEHLVKAYDVDIVIITSFKYESVADGRTLPASIQMVPFGKSTADLPVVTDIIEIIKTALLAVSSTNEVKNESRH